MLFTGTNSLFSSGIDYLEKFSGPDMTPEVDDKEIGRCSLINDVCMLSWEQRGKMAYSLL